MWSFPAGDLQWTYSEYDVLMDLNSAHILEAAENGIAKHIWLGTGTSLCRRLARTNDIWLWGIGQTTAGLNISPRYWQVQIHGSVLQSIFCTYVLLLQICWPILKPCAGARLELLLAERSPRHAQLRLYQEVSTIFQNDCGYDINNP